LSQQNKTKMQLLRNHSNNMEENILYVYGASRFDADDHHDGNVSVITLSPSIEGERTYKPLWHRGHGDMEGRFDKRRQIAMRGRSLAMESLKLVTVMNHQERNGSIQRNDSAEMMPAMPIRQVSKNLVEQIGAVVPPSNIITSEERFRASTLDSCCEVDGDLKNRSQHGTPVMPQRRPSKGGNNNESQRGAVETTFIEEEDVVTFLSTQVPCSIKTTSTIFNSSPLSLVSCDSTIDDSSSRLSPKFSFSSPCLGRWDPEEGTQSPRKTLNGGIYRRRNICHDHEPAGVTPTKQKDSNKSTVVKIIPETSSSKTRDNEYMVYCYQKDGIDSTCMTSCGYRQTTPVNVRIRQQQQQQQADIDFVPTASLSPLSSSTDSSSNSNSSNPSAPPRQPRRVSSAA
jgi:hypothetical protein